MIIQPFRIKESEGEDNFADIYEFIIIGSKTYKIELLIDEVNNLGLISESCTCSDFRFRKSECKHIIKSKSILVEFGILDETGKDMLT